MKIEPKKNYQIINERVEKKLKPFILWLTGISNSGKTTISNELEKKIKFMGYKNVKNIDGDDFRKQINNFSYDNNSRDKIGYIKLDKAKKYILNDYSVIVSGIAYSKNWRHEAKLKYKELIEVYIKCSLNICIKRDKSGNYKEALEGKKKNFVGIAQKYQEGKTADIEIDTEKLTIDQSVEKIFQFLTEKRLLNE